MEVSKKVLFSLLCFFIILTMAIPLAPVVQASSTSICNPDQSSSIQAVFKNNGQVITIPAADVISWSKHVLDDAFGGASCVYAADINHDGYIDILSAAYSDDDIVWWENDGNNIFSRHVIDDDFDGANGVYAIDVDGDGDMDVTGVAREGDDVAWWKNDGNQNFTKYIIDSNFDGPSSVYAADLDGDGDIDIISTALNATEIAWWENDGSENFTKHSLDSSFGGASRVYITDIDRDGDMDILACAYFADQVAWWENNGSHDFTKHIIDGYFDGVQCIYAADADGDGDIDVLGAASYADQVAWWENNGNNIFTKHIIESGIDSDGVYAADIDGDGYTDVLMASDNNGQINWYRNNSDGSFTKYNIDSDFLGAHHVYATDIDGDGDIDVIGSASDINDIAWYENLRNSPGPTPGDTKIVFQSARDGHYEIYVMNIDGSNQTRLTYGTVDNDLPTWSPDGKSIFFVSERDGNDEIYVMNADGSNQTRLTNNPAAEHYPVCSPDGSKIAFRSNRTGNYKIYVMNVDGSDPVALADGIEPAWSPDGSKIAYIGGQTDAEIYVMNADGSNQTNLTNYPAAHDLNPTWFPDGSKILFVSERTGHREFYVMNADGSNQTQLTTNASMDTSGYSSFSPDGSKIAFESNRDGNWEIYIMNADGSNPTRLTDNSAVDFYAHWSPFLGVGPGPAPVADFNGAPLEGPAPLVIQFTDQSTGSVTSWSWDFGDGGTSTEQNPSHIYNTVGTYSVSLTVSGSSGTDTEVKSGYIKVLDFINLAVPLFSQRDPQWDYKIVGESGATIGQIGCAITCAAMVLKYNGVDTNPDLINSWLSANSGYTPDGAISSWNKPADYSNGKIQLSSMGGSLSDNDNWNVLDNELSNGYPVIVQVDADPSTYALDGHWVVVRGKQDSDYSINDPWDLPGSTSDVSPNNLLSDFYDASNDNTFFKWRVFHNMPINHSPTADFNYVPFSREGSWESNPAIDETITFTANCIDPDGDALTYSWDFGDEGDEDVASGVEVTYKYDKKDNYDVTLQVTDEHGATASVSKTVKVVPEWRKEIRIGDILFDPSFLNGLGHTGIYYGLDLVVEAQAPVVESRNLDTWDNRNGTYLIRVQCSDEIAETTAELAWEQIGKVYDFSYLQKNLDLSQDHWYCSELVWAVYKNAGNIDLEYTPDFWGISPLEIYLEACNKNISFVVSHHGDFAVIPEFDTDDYTTPENWWVDDFGNLLLTVFALCPVDIQITDPDGLTFNSISNEIEGAVYMVDDLNEDGASDKWVVVPMNKAGDYLVTVIPDADASPTDTYTLKVLGAGTNIILANDVQIRDIPDNGYIIQLIENGITAWDYSFKDSTRGTQLYINTDNGTFQFITPDKEYPIKKATRMKIIDCSKGKEPQVKYDSPNKKWKLDGKKLGLDNNLRLFAEQHQFSQRPDKIILINHKDSDLQISAVVVDGKEDSCVAIARDLKTKKLYLLIVKPELKKQPKKSSPL